MIAMALAISVPLAVAWQLETVPVQVKGTVGARPVTFANQGECHASSEASIYDVPAAMWHVSASDPGSADRVNLTLWQPKAGGPMQITLTLQAGASAYEIGTVRGGRLSGSGRARVERQGQGGTLVVDGQAASGAVIQLSVSCGRFTAPEDNG